MARKLTNNCASFFGESDKMPRLTINQQDFTLKLLNKNCNNPVRVLNVQQLTTKICGFYATSSI